MSDPATRPPIRFIQTHPGTEDHAGLRLLAAHRVLAGPDVGARTAEQMAHRLQVQFVKVGYHGGPIYEYTCPICGIRWRN